MSALETLHRSKLYAVKRRLWAVRALFIHLRPTLLHAILARPNTSNDLDTAPPLSYTVGHTSSYTKFTPADRKDNIYTRFQ